MSVNGTIYFASELKSLRSINAEPQELPAGKMFSSKTGTSDFQPFRPEIPNFKTPAKAKNVLRKLLFKATEERVLKGDVDGVALSGGLDSSIIASLALELNPDIHFFTVGTRNSPDIYNAEAMSSYLGAKKRQHILTVNKTQIENAVHRAIWYLESFEQDCVCGCIANFFLSQCAAEYANCCLCGEGADELFSGYRIFKEMSDAQRRQYDRSILLTSYNTSLRRLDRGWLSHSVNYRAPFLDPHILAFSSSIPPEWKIHGRGKIEKWILREAFKENIPDAIVHREKDPFSSGSGIDALIDSIAQKYVSSEEFAKRNKTPFGFRLRSPKELWFYDIFKSLFPKEMFEKQAEKWNPFE
ncbi:MAG: hypothetical protein GF350_06955 [Chitinivibrionales bacterium]|nr:hypothetical protein [Chitinivibrionales bacterium]